MIQFEISSKISFSSSSHSFQKIPKVFERIHLNIAKYRKSSKHQIQYKTEDIICIGDIINTCIVEDLNTQNYREKETWSHEAKETAIHAQKKKLKQAAHISLIRKFSLNRTKSEASF